MEFVIFLMVSVLLLPLQIIMGTNNFKDTIHSLIGERLFKHFYRMVYIILSIIIYVFIIKLFISLPQLVIINFEDTLNNFVFLAIDTIRLLALFLIFEALWELDLFEFLGIKQIWYLLTKKDLSTFKKNRIRTESFVPKGLYLRHRQPIYFYIFIFFVLDRTLTVNNLLFLILFSVYYYFSSKQQESRLLEDYGDSYKEYQEKVKKYIPMWKRYGQTKAGKAKNESAKK